MKKKSGTTIFHRIFLPMLIIIGLQCVILYAVLVLGGVLKSMDHNSLNLLRERTQNKQQMLMTDIVNEWTNLQSTDELIQKTTAAVLAENGKSWDDIAWDAALDSQISERCYDALTNNLHNNKTTGIFLILDSGEIPGMEGQYAGVYLRDRDPLTDANDDSDLQLLCGLPGLAREKKVSFDSCWKAYFDFREGRENSNNRFFFNPIDEAKRVKLSKSTYGGYWSRPFRFGGSSDLSAITYSYPLLNSAGKVYGVLGVELSETYLVSLLTDAARQNMMYMLAVTNDGGKTYERITASGMRYKQYFSSTLETFRNFGDRTVEFFSDRRAGTEIIGQAIELQIYNPNTAFENDHWMLIGMQDRETLFASTRQLQMLIILSIAAAMAVGLLTALIASRRTVRPVRLLMESIRSRDMTRAVSLPVTGIREVDELSRSISQLNQDVINSATRTSKLIEMCGLPIGVYELHRDPQFIYCSDGFCALTGCSRRENLDEPTLRAALSSVMAYPIGSDVYRLENGNSPQYLRISQLQSESGEIGTILDVTREIEERQRIERERDQDSLTGIWNRRAFEKELGRLLHERGPELKIGALLMFDLDNLKFVNDAFGHDCGDQYIRAFANILHQFDAKDTLIARRSGDEFYMFLYGFHTKDEARARVNTLWTQMNQCFMPLPDGTEYRIRVSGGLSWYPDDAEYPTKLIHYADFAMYCVKNTQKGSLAEFDRKEYRSDSFLFNGHNALDRLIDDQLVHFAYQPIVAVKTGRVCAYELLMRSDVEQLPSPNAILRLAKSQGKLYHIERITWFKGLESVRQMRENQVLPEHVSFFLNSIANQNLSQEDQSSLVALYSDLMKDLVLEVTESEDNNMEFTNQKLDFVHRHGGRIAIDDFGTGYNSEIALVMIPANIVKIDISFVRNIDRDQNKQILVQNLIRYARSRNIEVLAEGVETREEMEAVVRYGVDYMQGYYFGRPEETPKDISEQTRIALKKAREQ